MTESIVKTIRFNSREIKEIEEFLENNPLLDFSTLIRMSVTKFTQEPEFKLKPNSNIKNKGKMYGSELKQ